MADRKDRDKNIRFLDALAASIARDLASDDWSAMDQFDDLRPVDAVYLAIVTMGALAVQARSDPRLEIVKAKFFTMIEDKAARR